MRGVFINKKLIAALLGVVVFFSVGVNIFASDVSASIPQEALDLAAKTQQEVICVEEGVYTVGEATFIDVSVRREFIDLSGNEISNDAENTMIDKPIDTPVPYGSLPPSLSSVWDWSNGCYYGEFEMKELVYTNYRFTGYSTYEVLVYVDPWDNWQTTGKFAVLSIQERNSTGATYRTDTGSAHVYFTGCQPSEKLAFAVRKTDDFYSVTGSININGV